MVYAGFDINQNPYRYRLESRKFGMIRCGNNQFGQYRILARLFGRGSSEIYPFRSALPLPGKFIFVAHA
jgi:hypothetical protein